LRVRGVNLEALRSRKGTAIDVERADGGTSQQIDITGRRS